MSELVVPDFSSSPNPEEPRAPPASEFMLEAHSVETKPKLMIGGKRVQKNHAIAGAVACLLIAIVFVFASTTSSNPNTAQSDTKPSKEPEPEPEPEPAICSPGQVYISEAHVSGVPRDYVELHVDAGNAACSLQGWQMNDSNEMSDFTFGDVVIEAGAYAVFYKGADSFRFGLSRDGDEIYLCPPDSSRESCAHVVVGPAHGQNAQCFGADSTSCYCDPTPGAPQASCQGVTTDQNEQSEQSCLHYGMDYGAGQRPDGTPCGHAPTVLLVVDKPNFPMETVRWYPGETGRRPVIDISLDGAFYCQTLCRHTAGCDFFAYEFENSVGTSFHECYLKAGHEDSTCDQYTPWTNDGDPEYFSASGPKLCTPEVSEYYWTDNSGMMGWSVVNGTGADEQYKNGIFHSGMENAGWDDTIGSEWLYSGLGPHPFSIRDQGHEFFIIRSPAFYGPKMATWIGQGGVSNADGPGPNEQNVRDGFMGWVLRDAVTGDFVASTSMCESSTFNQPVFMGPHEWRDHREGSSDALARCQAANTGTHTVFAQCGEYCHDNHGIHQWEQFNWDVSAYTFDDKLYTFDIIDSHSGSWSHIETQDFTVYHEGLRGFDGAVDFTNSFDGHISIFDANMQDDMPVQDITVELWVKFVAGGSDWAGPIGAFRDDGSEEYGWNFQTRCVDGCENSRSLEFPIAATNQEHSLVYIGDDGRHGQLEGAPEIPVCIVESDGVPSNTPCEYRVNLNGDDSDVGRWIHWAGSYDGVTARMFIDGVETASDAVSLRGPINYPAHEYETSRGGWFTIGAYHDANEYYPFPGSIDEVRVWSVAREPTLVCDNQQSLHPNFYYQFNNGPDGPIGEGTVIQATVGPNGVTHGDVHRYRGVCHSIGGTARQIDRAAPVCQQSSLLEMINDLDPSAQLACMWMMHGRGDRCPCLGAVGRDAAQQYLSITRCRLSEGDNYPLMPLWEQCQQLRDRAEG